MPEARKSVSPLEFKMAADLCEEKGIHPIIVSILQTMARGGRIRSEDHSVYRDYSEAADGTAMVFVDHDQWWFIEEPSEAIIPAKPANRA
jgi:hypothetical protein